jgi:seryl-tRNA synthetase
MIDPRILRSEPAALEASLHRRGIDLDVGYLVALDERRRAGRVRAEEIRAEQKTLGKSVAKLSGDERAAAIARAGELADAYKAAAAEADRVEAEFDEIWVSLPNLVDETAADGTDEEDAEELRKWGEPASGDFLDHVELGERLGLIDIERAAKISGSRFGFILGPLVRLEFALVSYAFDHLEPHDDLYLIGTSEVALAGMHADEILDADRLPVRYAGFSTCFRRESGTYGKDTRGIFRVHQFDKVEMFSFVHPDVARDEHDFLLAREEELVQGLGIPYRVVNIAAGDLGASAAKKYDIEAWFPGQGRYREITSTSNTTDYQSRRLKIRFRDNDANRLVYTLNGTAIAMARWLIAIVENHQQPDGTIVVPEALRSYTGFDSIG